MWRRENDSSPQSNLILMPEKYISLVPSDLITVFHYFIL